MQDAFTTSESGGADEFEAMPFFFNVPGGSYDENDKPVSYDEAVRLLCSAPGKPLNRPDYSRPNISRCSYNFPPHISNKLDRDQLACLSAYKAGAYCYSMNAWLSSFPTGNEQHDTTVIKHVAPAFTLLYRTLEAVGPCVKPVFRGMRCDDNSPSLLQMHKNWQTLCKPGALVSLKTISSFSTERSVSERFAGGAKSIMFEVPMTSKGGGMESSDVEPVGSFNEAEVVPLCPVQFEILEADMKGTRLHLKLKQIFHKQRRFVVPRVGILANLGQIDLHAEENAKKTNLLSGSAGNEDKVSVCGTGGGSKMRFCQMCGSKIPFGVDNCKCFTAAAKAAKAARKFWICPKCGSTCEGEKCEMCSAPTQEEKKPQGKWDDELAQIKKVVEEPPCSDEKLIQLLEKKRGDVASVLEALWEM